MSVFKKPIIVFLLMLISASAGAQIQRISVPSDSNQIDHVSFGAALSTKISVAALRSSSANLVKGESTRARLSFPITCPV